MSESIQISVPTYEFSVEAYHRLVDVGILKEDDRVELIEGQIINRTPIRSPHAACVDRLGDILRALFIKKAIIRSQNPITLSGHSEPEPDLAVVKYKADYYETAHPTPKQVYIAIEISQSTEQYDRTIKIPLYAKYGVPEAWLVNLNQKEIEIYQEPSTAGYTSKKVYKLSAIITSDSLKKTLPVKKIIKQTV